MNTKNKILVLTLVISTMLITSCGNKLSFFNPAIQKLTQKAQQLMQQGDYEGAIARLVSINDINPELAENNYNLGIAYYKTDQHAKATDFLKKALTLDKDLKDAYYTLGVVQEEIAIQQAKELEKINNDKEKINELIKIDQNYKKAKENYVTYMDYIGLTDERKQLLEKIEELDKKIEEISKELPESEQEPEKKD